MALPVLVTGRRSTAGVAAYFDLITDDTRHFYGDNFHFGYFRSGSETLAEVLDAHADMRGGAQGHKRGKRSRSRCDERRLAARWAGAPATPALMRRSDNDFDEVWAPALGDETDGACLSHLER